MLIESFRCSGCGKEFVKEIVATASAKAGTNGRQHREDDGSLRRYM